MHESYDNDEDDYDDDQYNHDYPKDQYKWYYKFDIGPDTPISNWLGDMFDSIFQNMPTNWEFTNVPGFPPKKFPVNSYFPDTGKGNSFQYLGNNYLKEPIWKAKYFIQDRIQQQYVLHLQSNAGHFIHQPSYYKGLFDILN